MLEIVNTGWNAIMNIRKLKYLLTLFELQTVPDDQTTVVGFDSHKMR